METATTPDVKPANLHWYFTILTILSLNILALISVDRFIFIKFPLRYNKYVTAQRVTILVIAAWIFSIVQGILPLFGIGDLRFAYSNSACLISFIGESKLLGLNIFYPALLVGLALIPMTIIIVTNILIACTAQRTIRKVYRTRRSFRDAAGLQNYNDQLRKNMQKKKNKKQLVLVRAFGAILITNFVV